MESQSACDLKEEHHMGESYATIWTKERCRWLKRVGDAGPLTVIFGGPHIPMPPIDHVKPGDCIYVVLVSGGALYIVARMKVRQIVNPDTALRLLVPKLPKHMSRFNDDTGMLRRTRPEVGHRVPYTCVTSAALGGQGTSIRFDRRVPPQILPLLRLGPKGHERPLQGISGTALRNGSSFQGHVRRLRPDSAQLFANLLEGPFSPEAAL